MMQLGFVTAILPDLSFNEVLSIASEMQYDCVEVMCWPKGKAERRYAGVTHIDVSNFDDQDAKTIHQLTEENGVSISGLGYYPNALSPDTDESASAVRHLREVIRAAATLGLSTVNTFIGRDWTKSVDDNWPRFLDTWCPLIEFAEEYRVNIGIENCPMLFSADEWPGGKNLASSPAIWRRMFEAIPSKRFGLNFDPSHLCFMQMDYVAPIREFKDRIFHVHAKDVRVDRHQLNDLGVFAHPNSWHTPKLPGLGEINWGNFFATLCDAKYSGPVCVEVEDRYYEGALDSRKQALKQSATFLRNFIPET